MPAASTTKAMSAQAILAAAKNIPSTMRANLIKCLSEGRVKAKDDLAVIEAFLKATAAVEALPRYKAMVKELEANKHCVRCHTTFSDEDNKFGACVIPHVFDPCNNRTTYLGVEYPSECCGERVMAEEEGAGCGDYINMDRLTKCYKGSHTTDIRDVKSKYNDINIFPCEMEDGECVRCEIYDDDREPVWTCNV